MRLCHNFRVVPLAHVGLAISKSNETGLRVDTYCSTTRFRFPSYRHTPFVCC
jgi:hypothetical protein